MSRSTVIAYSCLAVIIALYIVGAVSHGSLRHEVQTLPLWIPLVLGFRGHSLAKWFAMPCLVFWAWIMIWIWLFLLGWAHLVSGHFSPTERAMTIVIGIACAVGIITALRWRTTVAWPAALGSMVLSLAVQFAAFRVSLLPGIRAQ